MSTPTPPDRCIKKVYKPGGVFRGTRCSRDAVKDGYCTQHHPDIEKARRDKNYIKFIEQHKREQSYAEHRAVLTKAGKKAIDLLRKAPLALHADYEPGDNKPCICSQCVWRREVKSFLDTLPPAP